MPMGRRRFRGQGGFCAQGGREPGGQGAWNPATPVVRVGRASRTPFQGGKLRPSGRDPFGRQPPAQAPSALLLRGGWEPLEMRLGGPHSPPSQNLHFTSRTFTCRTQVTPSGRPMTTSRQQHPGRRLASSGPSDVGGKRLESPCVAARGQQLSSSSGREGQGAPPAQVPGGRPAGPQWQYSCSMLAISSSSEQSYKMTDCLSGLSWLLPGALQPETDTVSGGRCGRGTRYLSRGAAMVPPGDSAHPVTKTRKTGPGDTFPGSPLREQASAPACSEQGPSSRPSSGPGST